MYKAIGNYNGKDYYKKYKAHDLCGNPVYKIFYCDGSTEIAKTYILSGYDKYYHSLSGLYRSK